MRRAVCPYCTNPPGVCKCQDKAGKSRTQKVTKDEDTHRYVSPKEADPNETYNTTEEHRSSWMKEWIRLGKEIEECYSVEADRTADSYTIAAVLHAQALKRVDR